MSRVLSGGKSLVLVLAIVAAIAIGSGSAFAALAADAVTYYGCLTSSGTLYNVATTALNCKKGDSAVYWNQTGPQGLQGPKGDQGAQGLTGPQGPQGPIGLTGSKGDTGAMGPQGPAGADGAQGLQGPTGPEGPQGPAGPTGPQGPAGANGVSGVELVVATQIKSAFNDQFIVLASCPAGKKVTGGGFASGVYGSPFDPPIFGASGAGGPEITDSHPTGDLSGWQAFARRGVNPADQIVKAYAICVNAP